MTGHAQVAPPVSRGGPSPGFPGSSLTTTQRKGGPLAAQIHRSVYPQLVVTNRTSSRG